MVQEEIAHVKFCCNAAIAVSSFVFVVDKFCADNGYVAEHDWHKIMAAVKSVEKRLELERELIKHSHEMER